MKLYNKATLTDLTICIFSFNRKLDLERLIKFISRSRAQILILDASHEAIQIKNTTSLRYIHVPNMPLNQRLKKFSELATTKYILLSPDDDYWAINGLIKTVKFLEMNLDYASAQGLRVRFFELPFFHWIPDYIDQMKLHYFQNDKIERLIDMATGMHYIYSVIRRTEFLKITSCLLGVELIKRNSFAICELIFNYTLPILGKHRILPVFYSARKAHAYEGSDINFSLWVNDKSDKDSIKFRENMIDFYSKELEISLTESESIFQYLTYEISRQKPVIIEERFTSSKIFLRNFLTVTKLRVFRKMFKLKYLSFYWLLFSNKGFILYIQDILCISQYLKKHRLGQ